MINYETLASEAIGVEHDNIIAAPFAGEFGWLTGQVLRSFDLHKAKNKIVCCPETHKVFYPSATGFHHDYELEVKQRVGLGKWFARLDSTKIAHDFMVSDSKYSDYKIWYHKKTNAWKDPEVLRHRPKFTPKTQCDPVDVVFSHRNRKYQSHRNISPSLYTDTLKTLKDKGYTTGIVGSKSSSSSMDLIDYRSWDYDNEDDATVEMMQKAKLVVSTNTGIAHLAILLGVPLMLIHETDMPMVCFMEISREPDVFFHKLHKDEFKPFGKYYITNYLERII